MTKTIPFSLALTGGIVLALFIAIMALAPPASAHQAGSFDPADPNCMGKLTSFHAKSDKGIMNSAAMWPHMGIANQLGMDPADGTVQSFQKLSQAWCMSE